MNKMNFIKKTEQGKLKLSVSKAEAINRLLQLRDTKQVDIDGVDLKDARFYILGENGALAWAPHAENIENNTVMLIEF